MKCYKFTVVMENLQRLRVEQIFEFFVENIEMLLTKKLNLQQLCSKHHASLKLPKAVSRKLMCTHQSQITTTP